MLLLKFAGVPQTGRLVGQKGNTFQSLVVRGKKELEYATQLHIVAAQYEMHGFW